MKILVLLILLSIGCHPPKKSRILSNQRVNDFKPKRVNDYWDNLLNKKDSLGKDDFKNKVVETYYSNRFINLNDKIYLKSFDYSYLDKIRYSTVEYFGG